MQFQLTFEGNLGSAPEMRFTPSGKAVTKLSVGHSTRRRNPAGEWIDGPTVWIEVTCWEGLAERVVDLKRGDTVIVEARDDLTAWAYLNQNTEKPAARLQVTAANVAVSMRFASAQSLRTAKPTTTEIEDPWADAEPADAEPSRDLAEATV